MRLASPLIGDTRMTPTLLDLESVDQRVLDLPDDAARAALFPRRAGLFRLKRLGIGLVVDCGFRGIVCRSTDQRGRPA